MIEREKREREREKVLKMVFEREGGRKRRSGRERKTDRVL